jgi:CDP-diacylglycerol--glycerol-3-phosphate 3-phosphatidyltransferase
MNNINFPNSLTLIRISLIPILILVHYLPFKFHHELTAIIFLSASFTDWLDGFLARKLKQETKFGEFFDPIADKLIVVVALLLLLESYSSYLITVPAIIIISREILVSGLREWMAKQGLSSVVSVMYIGKVKTTLQMISITVLLYAIPSIDALFIKLGIILLFSAAALTLWSMLVYLNNAWCKLTGSY